jgi:NAD+ kinase
MVAVSSTFKPAGFKAAFRTIALIGRYKSRDVAAPLRSLAGFLTARGCAVLLEQETATEAGVEEIPLADYAGIGARADLAVVLGGDGTMLAAARALAGAGVPLVGVNQGRLGFMTDIAYGAMDETMAGILEGRYSIETRTMLVTEVVRAGEPIFGTSALNDVIVNKGASGRLIELVVRVDGEFVYDLRSDGLIVATPTGSTAYALSANGPIIQPTVPALALVPISPHTLSNRPIAVNDTCVVEITLKHGADARLQTDGEPQIDLAEGDCVTARRSPHALKLVHPEGYRYYNMLREKLHWTESPL